MSLYFRLLCFHLPLIPLVLAPFFPQTHGFQDILGDLQGQLTEQLNQWLGGDACRLQLSNLVGRSTKSPCCHGCFIWIFSVSPTGLLKLANILWIQVGILIGRQSKGVKMVSQKHMQGRRVRASDSRPGFVSEQADPGTFWGVGCLLLENWCLSFGNIGCRMNTLCEFCTAK